MKSKATSSIVEPATYQRAESVHSSSKPTAVNSGGSNSIMRTVTTQQQSESITFRITTHPLKINVSTK